MRLFIAALLPEDVRLLLVEYIEELKLAIEGVKWESADKLHVTLKFLGEVNQSTEAQVSDIVESLSSKYSPFQMKITRFGGFPHLDNPRVLFVGLTQNNELSELKKDIELGLKSCGFDEETRRFIPHITIGRVKKRFKIKSAIPIAEKPAFEISQIGVIKSELNREGSLYTPLNVFKLGD